MTSTPALAEVRGAGASSTSFHPKWHAAAAAAAAGRALRVDVALDTKEKLWTCFASATQTESHEDVDEAAAAQARLEAENSERALQNRELHLQTAPQENRGHSQSREKPVDLSSLSSRAKLVEKCLGERDVFDALFAPVSVETQESAGANFPSSGRTTFTMPVEAACTGVAIIRERPEAFVASMRHLSASLTATPRRGVCARGPSRPRKRPILNSDARPASPPSPATRGTLP